MLSSPPSTRMDEGAVDVPERPRYPEPTLAMKEVSDPAKEPLKKPDETIELPGRQIDQAGAGECSREKT